MTSPDRKRAFKPTVDPSQSHRKRMEDTFQLQVMKKEASMKRRRMGEHQQSSTSMTMSPSSAETRNARVPFTITQACQILATQKSSYKQVRDAVSDLLEVFSAHEVFQTDGSVPLLLGRLESRYVDQIDPLVVDGVNEPDIVSTTLQVLINIVSIEHMANDLFRRGGNEAVRVVAPLLGHNHSDIRNYASLFLRGIAVENLTCKNTIFAQTNIIQLLRRNMFCQYTYERTVQLVAVLAENTSFELTRPLVHPLGTLFKQGYTDMSSDAKLAIVKALSNLSQGSTQQIQAVMETNTTRAIACFLTNEDRQLVHSSLKCLMNLTEGNESQTQTVISTPGVLSSVRQIIDSRKVYLQRRAASDALRLSENVSKRSPRQIAALFEIPTMESKSIFESLVETAEFDVEKRFRNPALHALANMCVHGMEAQVLAVFDGDGLKPLTQALSLTHFKQLQAVILDAIKRIWEVTKWHDKGPKCLQVFEEYNGNDKLQALLNSNSTQIQAKAWTLWDIYESDLELADQCLPSEEALDENIAPKRVESGHFSLSSPLTKRFIDFENPTSSRSVQQDASRSFGNPNHRGF